MDNWFLITAYEYTCKCRCVPLSFCARLTRTRAHPIQSAIHTELTTCTRVGRGDIAHPHSWACRMWTSRLGKFPSSGRISCCGSWSSMSPPLQSTKWTVVGWQIFSTESTQWRTSFGQRCMKWRDWGSFVNLKASIHLPSSWLSSRLIFVSAMASGVKRKNIEGCTSVASSTRHSCGMVAMCSSPQWTAHQGSTRLHEDDKNTQRFPPPFRLHENNRMPQGLINSPAPFMQMMMSIFYDETFTSPLSYLDDLCSIWTGCSWASADGLVTPRCEQLEALA